MTIGAVTTNVPAGTSGQSRPERQDMIALQRALRSGDLSGRSRRSLRSNADGAEKGLGDRGEDQVRLDAQDAGGFEAAVLQVVEGLVGLFQGIDADLGFDGNLCGKL